MGTHGIGLPADGLDNQGWKLFIVSVVMITSAGLVVIARLASRYWFLKLGWDDLTIVLSLLFSLIVSVFMILAIQNGYGMHKADLDKAELRTALKYFFVAQTPYKVTVCLNKVSAILLYLRIFISRPFRISAFAVMAIIVCWSIGAIGATIWQCVPIQGAWNKGSGAKCINSDSFWVAYAVVNILTDVMVLALPIPPVLRLKLSLRDRLMLCCVFLIGGFTTIASILRTTSVQNSLKNKDDTTYNFIQRGMWTLIEANLGIISACLPVLKQPLSRLFPRLFGSTKSSSYIDNHLHGHRGYNLSNMSGSRGPGLQASSRRASAHPGRHAGAGSGIWRGPIQSEQKSTISGPGATTIAFSGTSNRKSDELRIITDTKETDSDLGGSSGGGSYHGGGISKRVDIHMDA